MKNPMMKNENGFSFIELMVVVVILGILAGMIVPRYMGRTDDAKVIKAKMDIAAIETSLKMYYLDNGFYPTTEQGLKALVEKPTTEPVPVRWNESGYLDKRRVPKDPWSMTSCPMGRTVFPAGRGKTRISRAGRSNETQKAIRFHPGGTGCGHCPHSDPADIDPAAIRHGRNVQKPDHGP
jgi:general secretion pathway protein G